MLRNAYVMNVCCKQAANRDCQTLLGCSRSYRQKLTKGNPKNRASELSCRDPYGPERRKDETALSMLALTLQYTLEIPF